MPKFAEPSDLAAQWTGAMRGPAFFAYADNYLIDVSFGAIVDVETSRAVAKPKAARTMLERTDQLELANLTALGAQQKQSAERPDRISPKSYSNRDSEAQPVSSMGSRHLLLMRGSPRGSRPVVFNLSMDQ